MDVRQRGVVSFFRLSSCFPTSQQPLLFGDPGGMQSAPFSWQRQAPGRISVGRTYRSLNFHALQQYMPQSALPVPKHVRRQYSAAVRAQQISEGCLPCVSCTCTSKSRIWLLAKKTESSLSKVRQGSVCVGGCVLFSPVSLA